MWAQTWSGIMDFAIPYPGATQVDATPAMLAQVRLTFKKKTRDVHKYPKINTST